jgi:SAM-dependent methyltransferase/uncharacterized protein YbaR (Trm112 family)
MENNQLAGWLKEHLVCPRDHNKLIQLSDDILACPMGHKYPIVDGIPIMLLEEKIPTQEQIVKDTFKMVETYQTSRYIQLNQEISGYVSHGIDPYVQRVIGAVCGKMYKPLINRLTEYPIPKFPLSEGYGKYFLELGCNWGRWCISAAGLGYIPVGIDHNLDAIRAARRVAQQLEVSVYYLVADVRYLPFPQNTFDVVFSYSVLQHFDKEDARICLSEISRVLKTPGISMIQIPNKFGLRNFYHQLKRGFKEPVGFEVRYWKPSELSINFNKFIGPSSLFVDGYFSLNANTSCNDILPFWYRFIISCSNILRWISQRIPAFRYCADSLYVKSVKKRI